MASTGRILELRRQRKEIHWRLGESLWVMIGSGLSGREVVAWTDEVNDLKLKRGFGKDGMGKDAEVEEL